MGMATDEIHRVFQRDRHGRTLIERVMSHIAEWRFRRRYRRW